jgi:hypothetical protein
MSTTIFAQTRPIRTAYMVDAERFSESSLAIDPLIDSFVGHANLVWGGRCDPLIYGPLRTELAPADILTLRKYDPDRVHVLGTIGDDLLKQLDAELSLWEVTEEEALKPERIGTDLVEAARKVSISVPAAPIVPSNTNLAKAPSNRLLVFAFSSDCPDAYRRFLHRNFGTFYQWVDDHGAVRRIAWLEVLIREIETLQYEVEDEATFISSIRELVADSIGYFPGRSFPFLAPCELPSLHLHAPFQNAWSAFAYRIVLGKTPEDFVLFWNLSAETGAWKRPYQHFLWLDPDLLQSAGLASALVSWIQLQTDSYGSNRHVELLSRSLSGPQLEQVRETLKSAGCWSIIREANADDLDMQLNTRWNETRRHRRPLPSLNGNNAQRFVVTDQSDTIYLGETEPSAGEFGSVSWAVDLQIGRDARPGGFHGDSFWALPLRHGGSLASVILPNALSRVNEDWRIAAEINHFRHGQLTQKAPELRIRIPEDFDAVCIMLREPMTGGRLGGWDLRARLRRESPIVGVEISSEGKQLLALITLIGELWRANAYFGKRLWRDLFIRMAGRDARREENLRTEVSNSIWKGFENEVTAEKLERLVPQTTESVLRQVGNRLPARYLLLSDLLEQRKAEQEKYDQLMRDGQKRIVYLDGETPIEMDRPPPLSIEDLQSNINALIALNFLRPGLVQTCRSCGESVFYHVDDLRQELRCRGCGQAYSISIWTDWAFFLNSLAQRCVSGGSLAVALALSQIESNPSPFFWVPSLNIHHAKNGDGWREIDFACVTGGEFWIGEVKSGRVNASEIQRFGDVAELIRPDRAVLYVEHDQIDHSVQELVQQLRTRLSPVGVRVNLHALPSF